MADLNDSQASQSVKIIGADSSGAEQVPVQSTTNGAIHTNLRNGDGVEIGVLATPLITDSVADLYSSFSPDPTNVYTGDQSLILDGRGRLETHSTTLTDEGSFRDDFSGSSLNTTITGTVTFTNSSDIVSGSGTAFTTEVNMGDYIKKTSDSETIWVRVSYVVSDIELVLMSPYSGTTGSATGHISHWKTISGPGSVSVTNSLATISSGTAAGTISLYKDADYGPFSVTSKLSISQRIANQTIRVGVQTPIDSPIRSAVFQFTGTTNTSVSCITSSGADAADTQTTVITIPNNLTSASNLEYGINVSNDQITFLINGVIVATHRDHIMGAYDYLLTVFQHTASATVTNTNIVIDWHNFYNINQMEISNSFIGEPLTIAPVSIKDREIATYSASNGPFTVAASPTDVFTITGSATKVVRIRQIYFSASATNASSANFFLIKRSTANTGGTSTVRPAVPSDSDDGAATAEVRTYTANPTLGTAVGTLRSYKLVVPQNTPLGSASNGPLNEIYFGNNSQKAITLRGTSEVLALNMNGVTLTGNSFCVFIEWTEENI